MAKQWRKGLAFLGYSLGHAPDWTTPTTQQRRVARKLSGAGARAVLRREIRRGKDNLHLRIYESVPQARRGGPAFLEKTCRNLAEFRVTSQLAGAPRSAVLPEVHTTAICADRFLIYMDYLPEGESFAPQERLVAPLARSLHRLCLDTRPLETAPVLREPKPYFRRLKREFFDHLRRESPEAGERAARALSALQVVPRVICHNDLNFSNILLPEDGRRDPVFVDFGSMGLNHAGADLHVFAARAVDSGETGFLQALARDYARRLDLPERAVLLAAHIFAASTSLNRAINKGRDDPFAQAAGYFRAALPYV